MKKRATQADVAREAGLSVTTVSLVLNGRRNTRISEEAAERVREAAQRLDYSPDPTARSLRTGRTRSLAFVSDSVTVTRYASAMIRGALDAAEERGYTVLMAEVGERPERLEKVVASMLERRVDGLLFGFMSARKVDLPALPRGKRTVLVNGVADGLPAILPAEHEAGEAAVNRLLAAGHRRIAFIGRSEKVLDPYLSATIPQRYAGIDAAMGAAGLGFAAQIEGHEWEPELGYRGTLRMLDDAAVFTAILAANDRVAFGSYQALQERGLRVPQDVAVMSFDDEQLATYLHPPLTTMRLPYREMGALGARMLLAEEAPAPTTLVPMPLVERGSVA